MVDDLIHCRFSRRSHHRPLYWRHSQPAPQPPAALCISMRICQSMRPTRLPTSSWCFNSNTFGSHSSSFIRQLTSSRTYNIKALHRRPSYPSSSWFLILNKHHHHQHINTAKIASSLFAPFRNLTRSFWSSTPTTTPAAMSAAKQKAQQIIDENPVVVFSKSYCPYCRATKSLLNEKHAKYFLLELDEVGM